MRAPLLVCAISVLTSLIVNAQGNITYRIYTAKEGELPEEIAKRFKVSVRDILRANPNMVVNQPLRSGEVVLVPVEESNKKAPTSKSTSTAALRGQKSLPDHKNSPFARVYWVYTVQVGDTLTSIARKFRISPNTLAAANNLSTDAPLVAGQVLVVPVLEQKLEVKPTSSTETPTMPSRSFKQRMEHRSLPVLPAPRIFGYVGTVIASIANIHSAPRESAPVWNRMIRGTQVIITTERPKWYGILMINGSVGWVRKEALRKENRAISWDDMMRAFGGQAGRHNSSVITEAIRYLGIPYKYGGTSPTKGLDCSAFVQRVFAARGVSLPRTAAQQAKVGIPVPLSDLRPGDRLYFAVKGNRIDHCGIYIGNGLFIHASGRHGAVVISSLSEPIYARSLVAIRR